MGEPKIKKEMTIDEAAKAFNRSPDFVRKYIRLGVIPVKMFNGKPLKPYVLLYDDLNALFTVASIRSLKTEELGKRLGRKPSKKEVFQWPE
jgi:hypothetical protein